MDSPSLHHSQVGLACRRLRCGHQNSFSAPPQSNSLAARLSSPLIKRNFCLGCVVASAASVIGLPLACTISATLSRGGKVLGTTNFTLKTSGRITSVMRLYAFSKAFVGIQKVAFETVVAEETNTAGAFLFRHVETVFALLSLSWLRVLLVYCFSDDVVHVCFKEKLRRLSRSIEDQFTLVTNQDSLCISSYTTHTSHPPTFIHTCLHTRPYLFLSTCITSFILYYECVKVD